MFRQPRLLRPSARILMLTLGLLALLGAPTRRGDAGSPSPWSVWGGRVGPLAAEDEGPAFLAWGTQIQEISDPGEPLSLRARLTLPEVVEGLALGQGLLAASSRAPSGTAAAELRLWSLGDGGAPTPVGQVITLPGKEVGAVAIGYARAVVLTEGGVAVLRLKDLERPTLEVEVAAEAPAGVRAWDGSIALAAGRAWLARPWGLETLDLSRLESAPGGAVVQRLDSLATRDVAAAGDSIFALRADGRLTVLDASSGRVLDDRLLAEQPLALAAGGDRLAVVDRGGRRLRRFTVAERLPMWQSDEDLLPQGSARADLILHGENALLSLESAGLLRQSAGGLVEALPLLAAPRQLWPAGDRVWVAAGPAGLWELESAPGAAFSSAIGFLLLAGPSGLRLADPGQTSADRAVVVEAIAARGAALYLLTERDGMVVLLRDGPRGLRITGHLPGLAVAAGGGGLMFAGRRLIGLSPGGGVWTVDIADDRKPQLLGITVDLGVWDLAPKGFDRLAMVGMGALGRGRFALGEIPPAGALPPPAEWLDLDAVFSRVAVEGQDAVLSGASEGIAVVDLGAADGPRLLRQFPGGQSGRAVLLKDLLQLTEAQVLTYFLRQPGGNLRPLGRVVLPAPGLDDGAGRDAVDAGEAIYLPRGRAGVIRLNTAQTAVDSRAGDRRFAAAFLPALISDGELKREGCERVDAWLLLLDDRLVVRTGSHRDATLMDGLAGLAQDLRAAGVPVHMGRYGSQAEWLDGAALPWKSPDHAIDSLPAGRADLGLALGLRLLEGAAAGSSGRLGVLLTVAGSVDEGSQRLMEHQALRLDAGGVPVVRLDLDGDGVAATGRSSRLPPAVQAAARRGDWEGLARELAQNCW
ncbi:MAG: hypothetical protein IPL60_01510 [Ardenticatenia bacterium]|nr:hypothetical protein [Ardenticatenia bacterium]